MIGSRDLPPLPEGWVWTKVGKVVSFEYGKGLRKDKRDPYGTVPVYGPNGVVGHHSKPLVEDPCLIVGRKGAVGQVHLSYSPCWPIDTTYYVVPPEGLALSFLFYLLSNLHLGSLDKSTAIPGISRSDVYAIHIPLPPLPEQHRIVAEIEELFTKLDAGVKSLEKTKAQLKRYRQAVLKHAFEGNMTEEWRERHKDDLESASVLLERIKEERKKNAKGKYKELPLLDTSGLAELPEGWEWTKVGEICELINGRAFKPSEWSSSGLPIIRIQNLNNVNADFNYCDFEIEDKYVVNNRNLLFAWSGTPGTSFGAHIWNRGKAVLNQHIFKVEINEGWISKIFYMHLINHNISEYIRKAHGTAGLAHITKNKFENSPISIPSFLEQHKIVEKIERRFSVADDVEKTIDQSLKQSERLRHTILKTAFEGKLVPQDPNDEPASVLLERIKVERKNREIEEQSKTKNKRKRDLVLKQRRFNEYVK